MNYRQELEQCIKYLRQLWREFKITSKDDIQRIDELLEDIEFFEEKIANLRQVLSLTS